LLKNPKFSEKALNYPLELPPWPPSRGELNNVASSGGLNNVASLRGIK